MKNIFFIITFLIFINPNLSFGFLSDSLDLDMYKKIDSWIYDLELKYYDRELRWWDMNQEISDELNKTALLHDLSWDCFKKWMSIKSVNTLTQLQDKLNIKSSDSVNSSQIQEVINFVEEKCLRDLECWDVKVCWYSSEKINKYLDIASQAHQNAIQTWNKKLDSTFKIRRIWLYSDWIKENSSFDLMVDLQEINDIIFEKQDKYLWENNSNIWKLMESIISWKWIDEAINDSLYPENNFFTSVMDALKTNPLNWNNWQNWVNNWNQNNNSWNWNQNWDNSNLNTDFLSKIWFNLWNSENSCLTDESWFDYNSLNTVLKELNKDILTDKIKNWWNNVNQNNNSSNWRNNQNWWNNWNLNNNQNTWNNNLPWYTWWKKAWFWELWWYYENLQTDFDSYKKINDNSVWPCDNFFCITTKFVIYNNKLLWTTRDLSIEALIKRSNEHFKKFAWTSLMQAKMTTNNFEIWLRDINLPDMFHVWVQVTKKPVPLLWVDKEENDPNNDDFKAENMLRDYYKSIGKEYDRANEIQDFAKTAKEIIDCEEISLDKCNNKISLKNTETYKQSQRWLKVIETNVDKKLLETDMKEFYDNFWEFETFTRQIMDYTFSINAIIKEMINIPINKEWW